MMHSHGSLCVCVCVQTFKFNAGFFGSDPGHVVLLSDRLGQHALQPLQRGVALLCERRQTLVTGVEGRDVGVSVLWGGGEKYIVCIFKGF